MRTALWKIIGLSLSWIILTPPVYSQGLSGFLSLSYSTSSRFVEGEKTSTSDIINQSTSLNFRKRITPALAYRLNLRTRLSDSDSGGPDEVTTSRSRREVEPQIDLTLRNPMYHVTTGYRRAEQWSTASLTNESRQTREVYYSRFNLSPEALPSLSFLFNRTEQYDHLSSNRRLDDSSTRYTISSSYELPSRVINLNMNSSYTHNVDKTPLSPNSKSVNDRFFYDYTIGYTKNYWDNRGIIHLSYQGNYNWSNNEQFIEESGDVLLERLPLEGLYAIGTAIEPDVDVLNASGWNTLVDNDLITGTGINLQTERFHNIGIQVSSIKTVDRLFIYVNKDVSTDTRLTNKNNWKVFMSNFNLPDTWDEVSIQNVTVTAFSILDTVFRYEIRFSSPQNASYFKAVSMETVDALTITDPLVTEIEAHGIETVDETGRISSDTTSYSQRFAIDMSIGPITSLTLSLNYAINRDDSNPGSVLDPVTGIIQNIFTHSVDTGEDDSQIRTTRTYGASAVWLTHRLLTSSFQFHRNESFDGKDIADFSTDTYSVSLMSDPLPTLGSMLSLSRSDHFILEEKDRTSNSIVLTIDSQLHRDINMTTDVAYTDSELFETSLSPVQPSDATSYSLSGTIDARITRKLSADLTYRLNWRTSDTTSSSAKDTTSSSAKEISSSMTYRPGRLINIRASFSISEADDELSTFESLSIDWRPLPAINLSTSYSHQDTDSGTSVSDRFTALGSWQITEFMSNRVSYSYRKIRLDRTTESQSFNVSLSCRF
jgi:hypothetical protein